MYHVRSECTKHGMFFQNKSSAFKAYHVAEEQQHQQINYGFLSSPLSDLSDGSFAVTSMGKHQICSSTPQAQYHPGYSN